MTRDEAAEVILEGDAFGTCFTCSGTGGHLLTQVHDEIMIEQCPSCAGLGQTMTDRYLAACILLGLSVPTPRGTPESMLKLRHIGGPFKMDAEVPKKWR